MARRKAPSGERLAYSVAEAAELVGVSPDLVYGWLRDGELSAIRLNSQRFILREDLLAFLRGQREAPRQVAS